MYKEAEEGLISEGRDAKLEFARGVKEQPISERDAKEFLFLIGSFCSREFWSDAVYHIWKTKAEKHKRKVAPRRPSARMRNSADTHWQNSRISKPPAPFCFVPVSWHKQWEYWYVLSYFLIYTARFSFGSRD